MPVGVPKTISAAAERQGDETRVVTFFHAKQNATLSFSTRAREDIANIGRCRNGFAGNLKDHISGRETVIGGDACRVDPGDHDTFGARSSHTRSRGQCEAELADVSIIVTVFDAGPCLFGVWQFTKREIDRLFRTFVQDRQLY